MPLRVVFFGTPVFAVPTLTEIVGQGHDVAAVYTMPPRAAGRGMAARRSPVHDAAERFGIPVETPRSLKTNEATQALQALDADVGVVVAYGLILPAAVLAAPASGCLNLHASLLPRWRGAAPIARAIMAGDQQTGVMVMQMDEGLDTGPVAMAERVAIGPETTAGELTDRLSRLGADLMVRALAALSRDGLTSVAQSSQGATYARKIDKSETRIDWSKAAADVHDHIRGLSPEPGAWFEGDFGRGPERIKVLKSQRSDGDGAPGSLVGEDLTVACGSGAVRLVQLQRAGKQPVNSAAFLNGVRQMPKVLG